MAATTDFRAARRYAGALFNVAVTRNETDAVAQNLVDVTSVVTNLPQLMGVLHHPRITRQKKQQILAQVFHDQVRPDAVDLIIDAG